MNTHQIQFITYVQVLCVICSGMDSHPLTDHAFASFKASLDAEMKRLQGHGTRSITKQAEVLTEQEEELLWEKGLLGGGTPQSSRHYGVLQQALLCTTKWEGALSTSLRALSDQAG